MGFLILIIAVALIVYFFASSKTRRDTAVESRVNRMVSSSVSSSTFPDLYYEAAKSYAISKGATAADHESASAKVVISGTVYFVVFIRDTGGGTIITVERDSDVTKRILDDMNRMNR